VSLLGCEQLGLGGNQIDDAGATSLAEALTNNTTLQTLTLDLQSTVIGDASAAAFAKALATNHALTLVCLAPTSLSG